MKAAELQNAPQILDIGFTKKDKERGRRKPATGSNRKSSEKEFERQAPMHPSPTQAINSPPTPSSAAPQSRPAAERAYRGLTIAAMLLILASILLV
jgi:hypothetical protein